MNNSKLSISFILFFVLMISILYLSIAVNNESEDRRISVIEIEGNNHLPKTAYFDYANLDDRSSYDMLTVNVIRDRFQKHPYVKEVQINFTSNGKVKITLKEKDFKVLLLLKGRQYLVTDDLELLPVLQHSKKLNYPVVRNVVDEEDLIPLRYAFNNESIIKAFKILTAARLLNPGLYDNLSEIDLRNGSSIVLYFSSVNYPVILGKDSEVKDMVIFEKLWESIGTVKASELLEYVDLRFTNKVYLGVAGDKIDAEEI